MKTIDLTHTISPNMPVFPGTEPPEFASACTIDGVGFLEKKIGIYSHTGTHIDAPAHILHGAKTLDQLSTDHFIGTACSLDLRDITKAIIDISDLEPYRSHIEESEFILLHTGWSRFWGADKYFFGYPVLSSEAATWLSTFGLKGVGFDMISADEVESADFTIHKIFLKRDIVIIENLNNLNLLPESVFLFSCFPLKIEDADGSPVRAVAINT